MYMRGVIHCTASLYGISWVGIAIAPPVLWHGRDWGMGGIAISIRCRLTVPINRVWYTGSRCYEERTLYKDHLVTTLWRGLSFTITCYTDIRYSPQIWGRTQWIVYRQITKGKRKLNISQNTKLKVQKLVRKKIGVRFTALYFSQQDGKFLRSNVQLCSKLAKLWPS